MVLHPGARQPALMFDADLGMRSGLETMITLQRGFVLGADRVVGIRWFAESTAVTRAAGVLGRVARYSLVDLPGSYFAAVLGHEVMGHGARYRELGVHGVDYGFDWPPPYGAGGGHASVNGLTDPLARLAVWSGGLEFQSLLQQRISLRSIARGELDYADALLLWWSWRIQDDYVQGTRDFAANLPDNDPRAYVRLLNETAGYTDPADYRWTVSDLKRIHRLNAVNPFLALALIGQLGRLWDGGTARRVPAIEVGELAYLPALRTGLTPFGPEVHLENYVRVGARAAMIDLAKGDETFHSSWWSLGATVQGVLATPGHAVDLHLRMWRQPPLPGSDGAVDEATRNLGAAVSLRGHVALGSPTSDTRTSLVAELGYKSRGFVEGYALDASPVLLVGMSMFHRRER